MTLLLDDETIFSNYKFPIYQMETGEIYVRNEKAIKEVLHFVRDGYYCTILGPRYAQKTQLLRNVQAVLQQEANVICLLVELEELDTISEQEFLTSFARQVIALLERQVQALALPSAEEVSDEYSFQYFLETCLECLECDLVLLINHLEHIWTGPLTSLLKVLRAIYVKRSADDPYRLGVVTASSLRVAELSLGPNSPFNIARLVWISDLNAEESNALIEYSLRENDVSIIPLVKFQLIQACGGDRYLLPRLCDACVALAKRNFEHDISEATVTAVTQQFMQERAEQHPPLQETIRALENDSTSLLNVVRILDEGQVAQRKLNLSLHLGIDELQLTGATRVDVIGEEKFYSIRNEIYSNYLAKHFHPERVVRVLSLLGEWTQALEYLETLVTQDARYRSTLLGVYVDSIYAAQSKEQACQSLSRILCSAFDARCARLYFVTPTRAKLERVCYFGFTSEPDPCIPFTESNRPEVRAYRSGQYRATQEPGAERVVLFPLLRDQGHPLGVMAVHGFEASPQRDEFLEMLAFLKQVSRAIGVIIDREQSVAKFQKLQQTGKQVTSSLNLRQVLQDTVEAAIEAVPAAQSGILFQWDDGKELLTVAAQMGYAENVADVATFTSGEGYTGWVFEQRKPALIANVYDDPRAKRFNDPNLDQPKSAISVPLEAWGRVIGVLNLENVATLNAFQQADLDLLTTFGSQAAIAIQNASLYTELYRLGMNINRGQLSPEQIFHETVDCITRVSDATGANLFLLRDLDDPRLTLSQKVTLRVSKGLGDDYNQCITCRPDGLTARVVADCKPHWVCSPDEEPGINPLALAQGICAHLCLPLMIQDAIIGVLFVHYNQPHNFSSNEIHMLSLFANQAALAIENARQRQELQLTEEIVWSGIALSAFAHRITQKNGAIRNAAYGLRRLLKDQSAALEPANRIDEYSQAIRDILGDVRQNFTHKQQMVDLNAALREIIPLWIPKEDKIDLDLSGLTAENATVYADPRWLNFTLEILTNNAVRAVRAAPHKRIAITSATQNEYIVVNVTNSGEMIPAQVRERLFKERISKAPNQDGTGIGLLHARVILRRYKGMVKLVDSTENGTTFELRLPVHQTAMN